MFSVHVLHDMGKKNHGCGSTLTSNDMIDDREPHVNCDRALRVGMRMSEQSTFVATGLLRAHKDCSVSEVAFREHWRSHACVDL